MRLFIAISCQSFEKELKQLQNRIVNKLALASMRLVQSFHLTLFFIGNLQESRLQKLAGCLRSVEFDSFKITLSKLGFFSKRHPRVIYASVDADNELYLLQKKLSSLMRSFFSADIGDGWLNKGFKPKKEEPKKHKGFIPHITLARIRAFENKQQQLMAELRSIVPEKKTALINSFSLYSSVLTRNGPLYTEILKLNAKENKNG